MLYSGKRNLVRYESSEVVCQKTGRTYMRKPQYRFEVNSREVCKDLYRAGVVPAKSLILKFPTESQIQPSLLPFFVRGVFEGDGHITRRSKDGRPMIGIMCSEDFSVGLSDLFASLGILHTVTSKGRVKNVKIMRMESIRRFKNYAYAVKEPFLLSRKYDKLCESCEADYNSRPETESSRFVGVSYKSRIKRWVARATLKKIRYNVGCYKTELEAADARFWFLIKNV